MFMYPMIFSGVSLMEPYLKSKLVEEVIQEVFNAAKHAVIKMTPRDVMKERPGWGRDFVMTETIEFLVAVNRHLEG